MCRCMPTTTARIPPYCRKASRDSAPQRIVGWSHVHSMDNEPHIFTVEGMDAASRSRTRLIWVRKYNIIIMILQSSLRLPFQNHILTWESGIVKYITHCYNRGTCFKLLMFFFQTKHSTRTWYCKICILKPSTGVPLLVATLNRGHPL